jgi:hypothetical protein
MPTRRDPDLPAAAEAALEEVEANAPPLTPADEERIERENDLA